MSKNKLSHFANYSLAQWLSYIEEIHATEIDMGLDRIALVMKRLDISLGFAKVITVAGTNGKGTTCAFIENALTDLGHSVSVYSSPHIDAFNERLRFNHINLDDAAFIAAFEQVESARADTSLTYYEFTTLAAFLVLEKLKPDYIILEVGLGGRLDATNVIDADIAVLTTVDLDHQAFLGNTREEIAIEKAGIMRAGKPAVIGEVNPPSTLCQYVTSNQVNALYRGQDFQIDKHTQGWSYSGEAGNFNALPSPHIPVDNVATAITVLGLLGCSFENRDLHRWIENTRVAGRTELFKPTIDGQASVMLDVGHNPQAAKYLSGKVAALGYDKVHAVFAMLGDKDVNAAYQALDDVVTHWYFGSLNVPRGASYKELLARIEHQPINCNCFDNVGDAYKMAQQSAKSNELILVFGSFFTVAEIRSTLLAK